MNKLRKIIVLFGFIMLIQPLMALVGGIDNNLININAYSQGGIVPPDLIEEKRRQIKQKQEQDSKAIQTLAQARASWNRIKNDPNRRCLLCNAACNALDFNKLSANTRCAWAKLTCNITNQIVGFVNVQSNNPACQTPGNQVSSVDAKEGGITTALKTIYFAARGMALAVPSFLADGNYHKKAEEVLNPTNTGHHPQVDIKYMPSGLIVILITIFMTFVLVKIGIALILKEGNVKELSLDAIRLAIASIVITFLASGGVKYVVDTIDAALILGGALGANFAQINSNGISDYQVSSGGTLPQQFISVITYYTSLVLANAGGIIALGFSVMPETNAIYSAAVNIPNMLVNFDLSSLTILIRIIATVAIIITATSMVIVYFATLMESLIYAFIGIALSPILVFLAIWEKTRAGLQKAAIGILYTVVTLITLGITIAIANVIIGETAIVFAEEATASIEGTGYNDTVSGDRNMKKILDYFFQRYINWQYYIDEGGVGSFSSKEETPLVSAGGWAAPVIILLIGTITAQAIMKMGAQIANELTSFGVEAGQAAEQITGYLKQAGSSMTRLAGGKR